MKIYKRDFTKLDGRSLTLYSTRPLSDDIQIEGTLMRDAAMHAHLRWHPLREEWVAFASHRQNRTFLPPKEYNPFAPMISTQIPTEVPAGDFDAAVVENLFPSLSKEFCEAPDMSVPTRAANGRCEVVIFTQDSQMSLGNLPLLQIELLLRVWRDRHEVIAQREEIKYILPFENRGVEVGATLHHPHGQIYAYPFIPPIADRLLQSQKRFWQREGQTLFGKFLRDEQKAQTRIIDERKHAVAFVPACAHYPYEVWVAPKRSVANLAELNTDECRDLAKTLKTVLLKYDGLWNRPFPYLMNLFSAPTDGQPHPEWHFHIEFFPPLRGRDRLKFLAGTELGAGMYVNDSLPEEKARELQAVDVKIE